MAIFMKSQLDEGMTLIEVLIALTIVAIAMTAIIKATSQTLRAHAYLKDKTIALLVAVNVMSEIKMNLISLSQDDEETQTETMLNHSWDWQANLSATPNPTISKVVVIVYRHASHAPLIRLEGYRYQQA